MTWEQAMNRANWLAARKRRRMTVRACRQFGTDPSSGPLCGCRLWWVDTADGLP